MLDEVFVSSPPSQANVFARLSESVDTILAAAAGVFASAGFWGWFGKNRREAQYQSFVAMLAEVRKAHEAALVEVGKAYDAALALAAGSAERERQVSERERQIGAKFERLYEERRMELHEVEGRFDVALLHLALNLKEGGLSDEAVLHHVGIYRGTSVGPVSATP